MVTVATVTRTGSRTHLDNLLHYDVTTNNDHMNGSRHRGRV